MKLIDYVIKNDPRIPIIEDMEKSNYTSVKKALLDAYCPIGFHILKDTIYSNPTYPRKDDKTDCRYRYEDDFGKCNACWKREILESK